MVLRESLCARAELYQSIRRFFADRNILEVETPSLSQASLPDPHIHSLTTGLLGKTFYLQTSPEFHMKRLLAAGSGSIYQICKAFRDDETGRHHNPEFTLLEWYHLDYNHHQLMDEMEALLQEVLATGKSVRFSYEQVFMEYLQINPLHENTKELKNCAYSLELNSIGMENADKDTWLNLLLSHVIEPKLAELEHPVFIYDFPISQAALARRNPDNELVAERFELYCGGLELANGFHELTDAKEQRERFIQYNETRQQMGLAEIALDEHFLQALEQGLPNCAGVALGLDRLLMLQQDRKHITDVIPFTAELA